MRYFKSRKRQLGAATATDIILTFPLFAILMLFIIQMALVLHAYTVVHYSAYKAARSARVHVLDGDHAFLELDYPGWAEAILSIPNAAILADSLLGDGSVTAVLDGDLQERIDGAAMNQLISISPAHPGFANGTPGDSWDDTSIREYLAVASTEYDNRTDPLMRKARYAYSDANTSVKFRFINFRNPVLQEIEDAWRIYETVTNTPLHSQIDVPMSVTVRFRYELQIPVGQWFFANETSANGTWTSYSRWMEATVKLM